MNPFRHTGLPFCVSALDLGAGVEGVAEFLRISTRNLELS